MKKQNDSFQLRLMLILILVICLSCKENYKKENLNTDSFYTIPFAEIVKNKREVKLSEIVTDVEFVQLENTPEAFFREIENIEFTKDYVFIQTWGQPIFQFSLDGKLVRKVGKLGRGPEEYNNCLKMSVDEENERVYIYTTDLNIFVFNFDGEYIKTIHFPALNYMKFWIWGRDSMFVSYLEAVDGNEPYVFIEYNEQGDTLQTIANHIFWDTNEEFGTISSFFDQNFSYRFESRLHLKSYYNDTVYTYDNNNKFIPKFFIDLGKYKLPEEFIYERKWTRSLPGNFIWTGVHETSNYVFLPYGYHFDQNKLESEKKEKGLVLYNKKTKEGTAVEEKLSGGFVDDLAGCPDFRPMVTNGNSAIMLVSALEMKLYLDSDQFKNSEVKSPEKKEKLRQLNKTLNENDNDFLVMVKLKD